MKLSSVAITLCNSKNVICTHGKKKSYVPYIWHWKVSKYQVIKKVDHLVTIVILFFLCILQVNYEVLFRINRNTNVQSKTMKKPTIPSAIIVIIRLGRSVKKGFLFWIQCFCVAFECYVLLTHNLLFVLKKKMLKFLTKSNTICIKKKSRICDLQNTLAKFISLQMIIFRYFLQCFLWILKVKSKGMLQGSFLGHLISNSFSELNMKTFFQKRKCTVWVNARYTSLHLLWLSYKCFV